MNKKKRTAKNPVRSYDTDAIFERNAAAGTILFETFGDRFRIGSSRAFGPTQAFVLRREAGELPAPTCI